MSTEEGEPTGRFTSADATAAKHRLGQCGDRARDAHRRAHRGSKAWKQRFESVLMLLDRPHSHWGEVRLGRKAIQVADVQPGTETDLRHFLESVVLQVNSELPQPEEAARDAVREADVDEAAQADRRMTAAFRSFAED